mmetsp:Transcript_37264/g.117170  ORF Transcript_37264/g.117170 Transcript_37264/m.117170 type:complete len:357 (+) Transcript_37264:45-1115(+)
MRRSISRFSRSSKSERSSTLEDPFAAEPVRGPSPRGPLTRTVSRFSADPDRAHDKKVAGLPIDPAVTAAKLSLRRLRDAVVTTASFYSKYAERKRGAASGNLPLLLPDLAEWSRHEAFCGDEESRRALHTCAAQLAAIDDLLAAEHAAIGRAAAGLRGEAMRLCEEGLDAVCAFELALRDASAASEAATKALRRGATAGEAAKADGRKAAALKDEKRRQAAQAAAQRAQERADAEVVQAEGAVRRADELFARLAADEQPAALRAAADARQRAEDGPVGSAAEALREAYGSFALGAARVLRGDRLPSGYCPTAKRKAPKETGARWFASCECALFLWAGITGFLLEAPGSRRTWCSGL